MNDDPWFREWLKMRATDIGIIAMVAALAAALVVALRALP
jgi:hypothetical protein